MSISWGIYYIVYECELSSNLVSTNVSNDVTKGSLLISQGAGAAIRPHLSNLVCCMLECLSSLEDQRLNYVEVFFNMTLDTMPLRLKLLCLHFLSYQFHPSVVIFKREYYSLFFCEDGIWHYYR